MAFKKLKYWFDKDLAEMLADKIGFVHSTFDKKSFVMAIDEKIQI
ncbi:hypothetical protein [Brumimicrobium glaciale]|nr:hypothetical protein [Brumimicrobium glaciale]